MFEQRILVDMLIQPLHDVCGGSYIAILNFGGVYHPLPIEDVLDPPHVFIRPNRHEVPLDVCGDGSLEEFSCLALLVLLYSLAETFSVHIGCLTSVIPSVEP